MSRRIYPVASCFWPWRNQRLSLSSDLFRVSFAPALAAGSCLLRWGGETDGFSIWASRCQSSRCRDAHPPRADVPRSSPYVASAGKADGQGDFTDICGVSRTTATKLLSQNHVISNLCGAPFYFHMAALCGMSFHISRLLLSTCRSDQCERGLRGYRCMSVASVGVSHQRVRPLKRWQVNTSSWHL